MSKVTELRREKPAENPQEDGAAPARAPALVLFRRRSLRLGALAVLALIAAVFVGEWLLERWAHVSIDDARIAADIVTVSSEITGRVIAVPVTAGDAVVRGTVLVEIDRAQAELELATLEAELAATAAEEERLRAEQDMIRTQVARSVEAGEAQVRAAEADHKAAEAAMQNAGHRLDRVKALAASHVVSAQELEQAQADFTTAEQEERSAFAAIATAEANLAVTRAEADRIAVIDRQIATLEAQKAAQVAERDRKRIDIAHGTIKAGFDGVVDATFVDPGEYVSPGTRLLMIHDPSSVRVDANVKETDFRRLKVGATATITVDAYPGRVFTGRVTSLGHAATSQFALLPSPNPSGNFTKVTQRLPIRVSIDQEEGLLRPGMMVEVSIDAVD